ncbi:SHOCT domain-containing protein [Blastococcus sp. SYSU D00695]
MGTAAEDVDYPLLDLLWTLVLLFALVLCFFLLVVALTDLFRRRDLSGWATTGWIVFLLVLPLIGSLTYFVSQGHGMAGRDIRRLRQEQEADDAHIRAVAAPGFRGVEEIARAKHLLDEGAISQEEFEQLKRRALV